MIITIIQLALHTLASQCGKIFRLKLGPKWNLVITDYEKIKVIFQICRIKL